uniref:Helicase ATP-binding domain-containing protein n=1 Tax=Setaria digitata TaxID=48799 RepID=A0A915PJK8_9BILA
MDLTGEEGSVTGKKVFQSDCSRQSTFSFNRQEIQEDIADTHDLVALAGSNAAVYNASAFERGFLQQVQKAFVQNVSTSKTAISEGTNAERLQDFIVQNAQSTFVKHGDMTPFEVLGKTENNSSRIVFEELEIEREEKGKIRVKLDESKKSVSSGSDSEYVLEINSSESEDGKYVLPGMEPTKRKKHLQKVRKTRKVNRKERDDGDSDYFKRRIQAHLAEVELSKFENGGNNLQGKGDFHELENGIKVPNDCWKKLYKYQKTGVRWLNELHNQCVGGILADEMGLGKTVQVISFLRALSFSHLEDRRLSFSGLGPVLIICPTTLIHQWLKEFHAWFPLCRVAVLHSSGSFHGQSIQLIQRMLHLRRDGNVLLTSYGTFAKNRKQLTDKTWHYVILDEGHKIRNPEAQAFFSVLPKSLIDFVYPGRLGALKSFMDKFSIPITQGGYANASALQVRTAYKCACVLRDAINPYLLRRLKKDVEMSIHLPTKTEQVLFCNITPCQRRLYQEYLSSKECGRILSGKMDAFVGLITLRKLCNHPDLITGGPNKFGAKGSSQVVEGTGPKSSAIFSESTNANNS